MNKALLILRYELRDLFLTRAYLITLLLPLGLLLLGGALYAVIQTRAAAAERAVQAGGLPGADTSGFPAARSDSMWGLDELKQDLSGLMADDRPLGYVDQAGLIRIYPANYKRDNLLPFADETAARAALRSEQIRAYYLIPKNFLSGMFIFEYTCSSNLLTGQTNPDLSWLIRYNLADGDARLLSIIREPILRLDEEDRSSVAERSNYDMEGPHKSLSFMFPALLGMGLWVLLIYPASLLVTALNRENESRTFEILLTSTSVDDLLMGKFMGLGLGGLLLLLAWLGCALFFLAGFGHYIGINVAQMTPNLLGWSLAYIIGGYFFLGMLMALVGALMPNSKDANTVFSVLALPGAAPILLFQPLLEQPNGALAVGLTFCPFTAPITVIMRLMAAGNVPQWQLLLGLGLLLASGWLVIKIAARLLRAQTLLTGFKIKLKST